LPAIGPDTSAVAAEHSPPVKTGFLNRIESVRGLAALCVAVTHTLGYLAINPGLGRGLFEQASMRGVVLKIVNGFLNGETAVIVFFVISGVVIGRSLDGRRNGQRNGQRNERSAGGDFVSFMIRRVLRLYPAHIVATLGILGLAVVFFVGRAPIDFAAYPGSYPAMSADAAAWLNGRAFNPIKLQSEAANLAMASWTMNLVVWSLYAEVCAAPFLPVFHRLARRASGWVDLATIAALTAVTLFAWGHLWSRYLFAFYLGMMVETRGLAWARWLERWLGGGRRAVALAYVLMMLPNAFSAHRSPAVILAEAGGAFTIISLIVASEGREPFRSLEWPVMRWNGRLSYSFYLWHFFIMTIAVRALYARLTADAMHQFEIPIIVATAVTTVAVALAIAQLSYKWIEMPSVALGRRLAGQSTRFASGWRHSKPAPEARPA
jgi:peptidoglycan/LPS O-acetylase OafA/YrhL